MGLFQYGFTAFQKSPRISEPESSIGWMSFYSTGLQRCKNKQINKQKKNKKKPHQNKNKTKNQAVEIRFLTVWQTFQVLLVTKHKKYTLGYNTSGGISPGRKMALILFFFPLVFPVILDHGEVVIRLSGISASDLVSVALNTSFTSHPCWQRGGQVYP